MTRGNPNGCGPIPVPPPRTQPSRFSSCVVSEAIPITGWGTPSEVSFSSSPPSPQPRRNEKPLEDFLPSAVGYFGLVQDEYKLLPPSVRSNVSLVEYEYLHAVLWWFRVYHVYQTSELHPPSTSLDRLPLRTFECLEFPIASSLYQHLSCLGDLKLEGTPRSLCPPLLSLDEQNIFGLLPPDPHTDTTTQAYQAYQWSTSPVLLRHHIRMKSGLFSNDLDTPLSTLTENNLLVHTSLLDLPVNANDLRHRSLPYSLMRTVQYLLSPRPPTRFVLEKVLTAAYHISARLQSVYVPQSFGRLSSFGSPLQLTFSHHLTTSGLVGVPPLFVLPHDRTLPSLPEFGFIPDDPTHIYAAIRLDFNPSIPVEVIHRLQLIAGQRELASSTQAFWSMYCGRVPVPLTPNDYHARKFLAPVSLTGIRLPVNHAPTPATRLSSRPLNSLSF
ncbi:unnamed protein product [Fusarium langsethiae]|nr:unnamed protein product [Fusarium langsethiae]